VANRSTRTDQFSETGCQGVERNGGKSHIADCTVRVFRQKFTIEDAIGSHACSLEANTRVSNGIPLGSSLLLPVCTVNCVQTLKAESAKERLNSLIEFMWMVIGTREQRTMLVGSSAISFVGTFVDTAHSHYQNSVLFTTLTAMVGKVMGASPQLQQRQLTDLKRVMLVMVILKSWGSLLSQLAHRMRTRAHRLIRESLCDQLTKHVLSQDLVDVEAKGDDWQTSPQTMLDSMTDEDQFEYVVLNSPQTESHVCCHKRTYTPTHLFVQLLTVIALLLFTNDGTCPTVQVEC
jgi:hypothetical protein